MILGFPRIKCLAKVVYLALLILRDLVSHAKYPLAAKNFHADTPLDYFLQLDVGVRLIRMVPYPLIYNLQPQAQAQKNHHLSSQHLIDSFHQSDLRGFLQCLDIQNALEV